MMEATKNKYTLETLLPLNRSYDMEHTLTQGDVDMANRLVEAIESSRSGQIPKIGDRMRHVDRHGDFNNHALLEKKNDGGMSVCLQPYVPFVGIGDSGIWVNVSGGPFTTVSPDDMEFTGWCEGSFKAWGHRGACANGTVGFTARVPKWAYKEPNPLYGDFTTETWRRFYLHKDTGPESRYLYHGDGIAFRNDDELHKFKELYEATVFPGNWESQLMMWCFREKHELVQEKEWDSLDLPVHERMLNGSIRKVKIAKDMERHIVTIYRIDLQPTYNPIKS